MVDSKGAFGSWDIDQDDEYTSTNGQLKVSEVRSVECEIYVFTKETHEVKISRVIDTNKPELEDVEDEQLIRLQHKETR